NYTDYVEQKELAKRQQQEQYEKYLKEKSRLKLAAEEKMKKADNIINSSAKSKKKTKEKPNRMFDTKSKGTSQKTMQRTAKAHEQRVEQLEAAEAPQSERLIRINKPKALQLQNKFPIKASSLLLT